MKDTDIQEGIILIPDFSGFTEFVFNTKLYTGEYIVRQLLSTLIDVNDQYFEISEIEAMPFYFIVMMKIRLIRIFQECFGKCVMHSTEK